MSRLWGSHRTYEAAMWTIGASFRGHLEKQSSRYPWHHWVRLAYNDALTHQNGQGGVQAAWRFRQYIRAPQNKELIGYANFLTQLKDNEYVAFDALSYSDFSVAAAFVTIQ